MSNALIIDDDADLVESIQRLAASGGYAVDTAATWDQGLAAFQALSPDLVIADYNLPGSQHGLRLLFQLAKLRPSVRLILMSAYLTDEDLDRVMAVGLVDRALQKTDPMATARAVVEEVRQTATRADLPTDWAAFARAARQVRAIKEEEFERLDGYLKQHRLPSNGE